MARPRRPDVPSTKRWCHPCGNMTEHRLHRNGVNADHTPRFMWRCMPCRNRRYQESRKSNAHI